MPIEMEVELRPHVIKNSTPLGVVDVELDQWYVLAARPGSAVVQVGYLSKRPGARIAWLVGCDYPSRLGTAIADAIEQRAQQLADELRGGNQEG